MTIGISPKAKLAAALVASLGTLGAILIAWAVLGELDRAALAGALTGVLTAALAFAGAYLGDPGEVIVQRGPASDALLSPDALGQAAHGSPAADPDAPAA